MRRSGILLPISSLPSPYGIGDFGMEARAFVDRLAYSGITLWQILPLQPVGYGNSPYQPFSSFAGEECLISPDMLVEDKMIDRKDLVATASGPAVDYGNVRRFKTGLLRRAFAGFEENDDFRKFAEQKWVYDYAVFMALKHRNGDRCWLDWNEEDRNWINGERKIPEGLEDEARLLMFSQYVFFDQWARLKKYANDRGVLIVGDIPYYVGIDSLDVWSCQECFKLDECGRPYVVAGVPPDYFSTTGQRWGNPIYDWKAMEKNGFRFMIDRIGYCTKLFDILRIDHFRAFDTYWEIPSSCPTAVEGKWVEAPGHAFLASLFKAYPDASIIVEDLGDLRKEVHLLRDSFGLMGMKVLEFALDPNETNNRFPDRRNMVLYTGTHDNAPIEGWFRSQEPAQQEGILSQLPSETAGERVSWRFVQMAFASIADYAIVQMQDVLGLGNEARLNTPGTLGSPNWEWHMTNFDGFDAMLDSLKELNRIAGRCPDGSR